MSCHTSFGYNSLTGNCYSTAPSVAPAAPNHSVQFNELNQFAGDGRFVYDQTIGNLDVPTITPDTIVDQTDSEGTNGQYLTSTGTGIEWVDLPFIPSVSSPVYSVQYNNGGDLGGDSSFLFNPLTQQLDTPALKPTTILDQTSSSGTSGQYLTSTATGIDWVDLPAYPTPGAPTTSVQFNDSGVFTGDSGFTFNNVNKRLTVTAGVRTNTIFDVTGSAGSINQILTSNGLTSIWQNPQYLPAAPFNSIQFNDNGLFGGSANFVRNPTTGDVNVNSNLGIGSLTAPTDRLVVTGNNPTIRLKSTVANNGTIVIEDSSSGVKQLAMQVNTDTADFTSIQQGVAFRNFRFNAIQGTSCISVGTTGAQAIGGFMCSNNLSNRKIILNSLANDEHRNISLGVNNTGTIATNSMRFQVAATTNFYTWNAATASNASNELMRLTGDGKLAIGTTSTNATGIQLSNATANRKIVLFEAANNEHQYYGIGLNSNTFRFQLPDQLSSTRYQWNAAQSSSVSIELMRLDGVGDLTLTGNYILPLTGKYFQYGDGSRQNSAPIYFYDSNATFNGTTGHRIYVRAVKKFELVTVDVVMQREGGIHFDLNTPGGTISTINIAVLPATWRPLASISTIGIAANNNNWATQPFCWGSFNCSTAGEIRMQSPNTLTASILNVQPNLEIISGTLVYLLAPGQTIYNSDGITR
jgi:hypothetical protein